MTYEDTLLISILYMEETFSQKSCSQAIHYKSFSSLTAVKCNKQINIKILL